MASSPDAAESVQARHRAVPRHRRSLEPRAASAKNTTSATTTSRAATGITDAGLGREKIFEVRQIHNDLTFIDAFLTLDFCREHKLFTFGYNESTEYYEIESREFPQDQAAAALQPDEPRPAADRGPRRQLQEPRRAVSGALVHRRRAAAELRPRHASQLAAALEPPGAYRNRARRRPHDHFLRRQGSSNREGRTAGSS